MKFTTALLNVTREAGRRAGATIPRMTVYRYEGFSRGDFHTYQVYFEFGTPAPGCGRLHIAGDFGGYDASEAKQKALSEYLGRWVI